MKIPNFVYSVVRALRYKCYSNLTPGTDKQYYMHAILNTYKYIIQVGNQCLTILKCDEFLQ